MTWLIELLSSICAEKKVESSNSSLADLSSDIEDIDKDSDNDVIIIDEFIGERQKGNSSSSRTKAQFCVCENKYDSTNSELCDRCSNRYHVQCAGDEEAQCAFRQKKSPKDSISFLCFKCRKVAPLIRQYEHELKASGRWDSDCESAVNETETETSSSENDDTISADPTSSPLSKQAKPVTVDEKIESVIS